MTNTEITEWLTINLPAWPETRSQCMRIPSNVWQWVSMNNWIDGRYVESFCVVHIFHGDAITRQNFLDARYEQRLKPCGMSFKEMIEDLCR